MVIAALAAAPALAAALLTQPVAPARRLPADLEGKISCHSVDVGTPRAHAYRKRLWDGYEISLGPARTRQPEGDDCTAAIYDTAGRVVFRTNGFNVIFDEHHTGLDFDGDGKPDVVFITDSGGGMGCCWAYNVVSLSPRPRKLFDIDSPGQVVFDRDSDGKMLIWQRTTGPYGFTTASAVPAAERAFRIGDGKLVDVTPDQCFRIFSAENEDYRTWTGRLTPANLARVRTSGPKAQENEETVSSLLSRAVQHVFCRQYDAALSDLDLWPESSRAQMKTGFAQFIKNWEPQFAARLTGAAPP